MKYFVQSQLEIENGSHQQLNANTNLFQCNNPKKKTFFSSNDKKIDESLCIELPLSHLNGGRWKLTKFLAIDETFNKRNISTKENI